MKYLILILSFSALTLSLSANDPYNYAAKWNGWNGISKNAYIDGVVDGIAESHFVTWSEFGPYLKEGNEKAREKATEKLFIRYTRPQIIDVITDLYRDPANAYISTLDMFFISRDKIEGKEIDQSLREARKQAMDNHKLNQQR